MVAVFSIFATLSLIDLQEFGVGLAAAVLIDATLIRGVVLPGVDEAPRQVELVHAAQPRMAAGARPPVGLNRAGVTRTEVRCVGCRPCRHPTLRLDVRQTARA